MPSSFNRDRTFFTSGIHLHRIAILVTAVAVTACASSRPPHELSEHPRSTGVLEDVLRHEIRRWEGTPHRLGGLSTRGADCSGFVYSVYRDLFGVDLPRTTDDQVRQGAAVRRHALQAGDLVFFRPGARTNHVGIYLRDGIFAHISTSQGLMYSRLDEPYWSRFYWTSRRVIDPETMIAATPATGEPAAERTAPPSPRRGGW